MRRTCPNFVPYQLQIQTPLGLFRDKNERRSTSVSHFIQRFRWFCERISSSISNIITTKYSRAIQKIQLKSIDKQKFTQYSPLNSIDRIPRFNRLFHSTSTSFVCHFISTITRHPFRNETKNKITWLLETLGLFRRAVSTVMRQNKGNKIKRERKRENNHDYVDLFPCMFMYQL